MTSESVIASRWHDRPVEEWRKQWGVPELQIFHRVGSTNDAARRLAEAGAAAGAVVIADAQTRGRGRRGRKWITTPGAALLLSMVLRPRSGSPEPVVTLRLGLGVARAIESMADLRVGIKWPNDLQVGGRKVAGLLCEGATEGGRLPFLVAGVGINVMSSDDWPRDVRARAISLAEATGRNLRIEDLAIAVIGEMIGATSGTGPHLSLEERDQIQARDELAGRQVTIDLRPAGRVAGIADDGALRVLTDSGERRILGGVVRIRDVEETETV